jgi:hypothetical protein
MLKHGFIYIFTEATNSEIETINQRVETPVFYKVGKAAWGKKNPTKSYFWPVENRQAKNQSSNPRPINCLRVFAFENEEKASKAENAFHAAHGTRHGVRLYSRHEWYHSTLPVTEVETWMAMYGGQNVTAGYNVRFMPGAYEEGAYEFSSRTSIPQPFIVYLLKLEDGGSWFRVLATAYDAAVDRWYNTGNPREIILHRKLQPQIGENTISRNESVRSLMASLITEFGESQSQLARKPGAGWNALAWVKDDSFLGRFEALTEKFGLSI